MSDQNLVELKVEGMSCANCASAVRRRLEKSGLSDITVEFATGEVTFTNMTELTTPQIVEQIDELGYHVVKADDSQKKNF